MQTTVSHHNGKPRRNAWTPRTHGVAEDIQGRHSAVFLREIMTDRCKVIGRQVLARASVDALSIANDAGSQGFGKTPCRLPEVTDKLSHALSIKEAIGAEQNGGRSSNMETHVIDDRVGEINRFRPLEDIFGLKVVCDHELCKISDNLAGWRDLDDIAALKENEGEGNSHSSAKPSKLTRRPDTCELVGFDIGFFDRFPLSAQAELLRLDCNG
jgi:hypothetical protein